MSGSLLNDIQYIQNTTAAYTSISIPGPACNVTVVIINCGVTALYSPNVWFGVNA